MALTHEATVGRLAAVAGGRRTAQPWIVVGSAALLYAAVLGVRWTAGGAADAVLLLFCVPIAMLAVAFGMRAGVVGSLVGVALLALWVFRSGVQLTPLGWSARVVPLLLVGLVLGTVVDQLRETDAERHRLAAAARRHHEAIEINDTIVQGLTAAKWSLEAGDAGQALTIVTDTLELGHRLVSDLVREAGLGPAWRGRPPEA